MEQNTPLKQPETQPTPQPAEPSMQSFQDQPKVQYVVAQKSLEGVGGWLAFFVVCFALVALGYVAQTFQTPAGLHTLFSPLLAIGYIASIVMIALQKKQALLVVYATLGLSLLWMIISTVTEADNAEPSALVGSIVGSILGHGLIALYFYVSKRVKATLTKA